MHLPPSAATAEIWSGSGGREIIPQFSKVGPDDLETKHLNMILESIKKRKFNLININ